MLFFYALLFSVLGTSADAIPVSRSPTLVGSESGSESGGEHPGASEPRVYLDATMETFKGCWSGIVNVHDPRPNVHQLIGIDDGKIEFSTMGARDLHDTYWAPGTGCPPKFRRPSNPHDRLHIGEAAAYKIAINQGRISGLGSPENWKFGNQNVGVEIKYGPQRHA
ncbi:hypothetical protein F5887DRAFT_104714 [Amanita rubescens]|nr:hypothetical protein F5887DRAFT_104714 [Amanita rubescens]